jgi:putative transposase
MRVVGLPGVLCRFSKLGYAQLSQEARERSRYVSCFRSLRECGVSSIEASKIIGVSRATLYRWERRLEVQGIGGLEERSRRPRRTRKPTWSMDQMQAVLSLREQYPRWGKDKLVLLLRQSGWQVSTSMVGRILTHLKDRGVLKEAPRPGISARKSPRPRLYAIRKPKEYQARHPGDLIELDTMDVRPLPGIVLKHFTARDVVSRWDVLGVFTRATANTASSFLNDVLERMPFAVKAVQVDGGPEFEAGFESACEQHGIKLFVLPPRSPKLNGHVERAHRTHAEEFYELYDGDLDSPVLRSALREWEEVYNCVRPHQALDGQTPISYLKHHHPEMTRCPQLSHI